MPILPGHIAHVVVVRADEQVIGATACRIVASMQDVEIHVERSIRQHECEAVGAPTKFSDGEVAIPAEGSASGPVPAGMIVINALDFAPEAIDDIDAQAAPIACQAAIKTRALGQLARLDGKGFTAAFTGSLNSDPITFSARPTAILPIMPQLAWRDGKRLTAILADYWNSDNVGHCRETSFLSIFGGGAGASIPAPSPF
jgi:hypothetical protein